jgi:CheY-like chemotaxis protein
MTEKLQLDRTPHIGQCALVADDDPIMRDILYSLLTGVGYTVLLAISGREALRLASNLDASIAFIDLAMPDGNGLQTCAALRTLPKWRTVPIIVLTHFAIDKALKAALHAGASGFVCKPLIPSELMWCIEVHTGKMASARQKLPTFEDFNLKSPIPAESIPDVSLPPAGSDWILRYPLSPVPGSYPDVLDVRSALEPVAIQGGHCSDAMQSGQLRILVSDNHPPTLEIIRRVLVTEGCMFEVARDGREVLSMFTMNHYDLVLINAQMPLIDGDEVAHSIRVLRGSKGVTPIIIMTQNVAYQPAPSPKDAGITEYLIQPITPESLLNSLLRHIPVKIVSPLAGRPADSNWALDVETLRRLATFFPAGAIAGFLNKLLVSIEEILQILGDVGIADRVELDRLLHNLAGTAGTLGFSKITAMARELEADYSDSGQTRRRFIDTAHATLKAIDAYVAAST